MRCNPLALAILCLAPISRLLTQSLVNPLVHNGVVVALSENQNKPIFMPFLVVDQSPDACANYTHQENNPSSIIRYFNCNELGTQPISVWTSAPGSLRPVETETYALVQNNLDICPQYSIGNLPIILCRNGLAVAVNGTGSTLLRPWEFDLSTVVCNNDPGIKLSFSADTSDTYLLADCNATGTNIAQIWATTSTGAQNYAEVYFLLQDNLDFCSGGDTLAPLPRITSGAVVALDYGGRIALHASNMDAGSILVDTLCAPLKFSFSQDTNDVTRNYVCGDAGIYPIDIWVTDACGHQNFASTFVRIQENVPCTGTAGIANDNRANAIALDPDNNCRIFWSNIDATTEPDEPQPSLGNCGDPNVWCDTSGSEHSVWFTFKAPFSGSVALETRGMNTQMAVWELVGQDLVLVAANDDDPNDSDGGSAVTLTCLEAGKTYWVQVDGHSGFTGQFDIRIENPQITCLVSGSNENALVCGQIPVTSITSTGSGVWQMLVDGNGTPVAAINDMGNTLGQIDAEFMIHSGDVRTDSAGTPYLNRNWTISVENQPATPVLVKLFFTDTEWQLLASAPSGPNTQEEINLTKVSSGLCGDYQGGGDWLLNQGVHSINNGFDLAMTFQIENFSAFYLHGGNQLTRTSEPQVLDAELYPVPAFGAVYLRGLPSGEFQISISDMNGKSVSGFNYLNNASPVALPVLPVGQYVLCASNGKNIWSSKLIIAE